MILTTNRITTFDEAIYSRIHLSLKYDHLNKQAKENIWKAFLKRASFCMPPEEEGQLVQCKLEDLMKKNFNRRQVRQCQLTDSKLKHALI
jgi:hypothetical protein